MSRAMSSDEYNYACRLANEVAEAKLALDNCDVPAPRFDEAIRLCHLVSDYNVALYNFTLTFPRHEWHDFTSQALQAKLKRSRP